MKISVCMATYNGSKYIKRQLKSILYQINDDDEVIIVDDKSTDNTCDLIADFNDKRIKLLHNKRNRGFLFSFQRAIKFASGDIIFLSDQDDEWMEEKIVSVLDFFVNNGADIIQHDAIVVNENEAVLYDSLKEVFPMKTGIIANYVKNSFTGCCMALKRSVAVELLPIPNSVVYHDRWLGIIGNLLGYNVCYIDKPLIKYCRHGKNTSPFSRNNLWHILKDRMVLFLYIVIFICNKMNIRK